MRRLHAAFVLVALFALATVLLLGVTQYLYADPDMWHEMALWREFLTTGTLPLKDSFAFTPTVPSVIHHEWGTGAVLYYSVVWLGSWGPLALLYLTGTAIAVGCTRCALRSGASIPVFCSVALIPILMSGNGFSAFRAQMFTLLCTCLLLNALRMDRDARPSRRQHVGRWNVRKAVHGCPMAGLPTTLPDLTLLCVPTLVGGTLARLGFRTPRSRKTLVL